MKATKVEGTSLEKSSVAWVDREGINSTAAQIVKFIHKVNIF